MSKRDKLIINEILSFQRSLNQSPKSNAVGVLHPACRQTKPEAYDHILPAAARYLPLHD